MSRVGKNPVPIAKGADVQVANGTVTIKGPKGTLSRTFPKSVTVAVEDGQVVVTRQSDAKPHRAMHGTVRALIANMMTGVTEGYRRELQIEGTGYRAEQQGKNVSLSVGLSHPVIFEPPDPSTSFEVPKGNKQIIITGIDKEVVGEIAAKIRAVRPPEPYKGKGIRYTGEQVRRKAGKAGKAK